jgi:hypothetical protein
LAQVVVWISTKAERSSAKEEDGEIKHEKANEEGVPSTARVPSFTHFPIAWETSVRHDWSNYSLCGLLRQ